ncbi:MAG: biliverdin-producing heme oxygenase [Phycisphaerales bacterium]|nr:biliverdin-producing heme oxygenase [Phycisphaerales bacterium]
MPTELTARLKNDNWDLHQIAERGPTPGALIKGTMPKPGYSDSLAQGLLIHRALDHATQGIKDKRPDLGALIKPDQAFAPYLEADLDFLGVDTAGITATPGTQRFIDAIGARADDPCYLFGLHYVRLGACNGNRFVARKLRSVYGFSDNQGTMFLDPFGEKQRSEWNAFKNGIDALDLSQDDQDRIFAGTRDAYLLTINLDHDEFQSAEALLAANAKTLDKDAFEQGHSVHVAPGETL